MDWKVKGLVVAIGATSLALAVVALFIISRPAATMTVAATESAGDYRSAMISISNEASIALKQADARSPADMKWLAETMTGLLERAIKLRPPAAFQASHEKFTLSLHYYALAGSLGWSGARTLDTATLEQALVYMNRANALITEAKDLLPK